MTNYTVKTAVLMLRDAIEHPHTNHCYRVYPYTWATGVNAWLTRSDAVHQIVSLLNKYDVVYHFGNDDPNKGKATDYIEFGYQPGVRSLIKHTL